MNRSFSIDVSSFLHHRIKSATQQECRCIIGGGLRGLVWGIAWLEEGDQVSLIDDRQEIGTPSRRVGWLESTGEGYTWLNSHVNLNSAQHVANSSKYQKEYDLFLKCEGDLSVTMEYSQGIAQLV